MAYAALVSLAQTIDELLHDHDRYPISRHEKQQIISIHGYVIFLQAFLDNFPAKGNSLEGRIRDVSNEIEDTIESFMWKKIRRSYSSEWAARLGNVKDWIYSDLRKLEKLANEIGSIAGVVTEIKNGAAAEDLQLSDPSCVVASSSSSRLITTSKDIAMVGFEDDLMAIKDRLCGELSKLQIIPIYGMGGIGKTTLAKSAYDDQLTKEYFDIRAWVTISQDYSVQRVLSSLIVSVGAQRSDSEEANESKMAEDVYKSLKGKRYLIVMDDMWSKKVWDDVRRIFPNDHSGSRIMLTTRLLDVAAYPDSSSPLHEMRFMDVDQSWNLLRKKVFLQGKCPLELEDIGKTIARSCRGLPLAIVVISGLLSTAIQTRASWDDIARNVSEAVSRNDEKFTEIILSSSYNHLPHHLRPCFLYMGFFPEDYEIRVSKLIKLWVAEGFLKLPNESKSWEEVAEEYLEDLVKRSLVLVIERKSNGKIKSCSVHDMVRDLCIRKAQQEKFLAHVKDSMALLESIINPRRVIMIRSNLNCLKRIYGSHIHTIICFTRTRNGCKWDSLRNVRLLRVLDVVDAYFIVYNIFRLPSRVINLYHLKFLALSHRVEIPAAISNLQNLQTLIIHPHSESLSLESSVHLPLEIWRMQQLRHLVSGNFYDLDHPAGDTLALENLQTLSQVRNFKCTQQVVQMIPNLKKLAIFYCEDQYGRDYKLENLRYLHRLERLKFMIDGNLHIQQKLNPNFPATLKSLSLSGCRFAWEDMQIVARSLPKLEVLKLRHYAFEGSIWETSEGEFPRLKFLLIKESHLREWITESYHFPSLKRLVLHRCWWLSEIPDIFVEIPTLELIEVDCLSKTSLVESAKKIQEEQQDCGNDALQVRIVFYNEWTKKYQ